MIEEFRRHRRSGYRRSPYYGGSSVYSYLRPYYGSYGYPYNLYGTYSTPHTHVTQKQPETAVKPEVQPATQKSDSTITYAIGGSIIALLLLILIIIVAMQASKK